MYLEQVRLNIALIKDCFENETQIKSSRKAAHEAPTERHVHRSFRPSPRAAALRTILQRCRSSSSDSSTQELESSLNYSASAAALLRRQTTLDFVLQSRHFARTIIEEQIGKDSYSGRRCLTIAVGQEQEVRSSPLELLLTAAMRVVHDWYRTTHTPSEIVAIPCTPN